MSEPGPISVPGMDELLAAREARGLRALVVTRQVVLLLFLGGTLAAPNSEWERWASVGLLVGTALPNYWLFRRLRRPELARTVGLFGAAFDVVLLGLVPFIWYRSVGWTDVPAAYHLKTSLPNLAIVFIVANAISLRPRYPLIVTAGAVGIMLVQLPIALADPRTRLTDDYAEVMLGAGVSIPFYLLAKLGLLLLAGLVTTGVTHLARRTVFEAAALERRNTEIQATRDQLVLQEKLASISGVVAGIAHEVNNPVGAIRSSADTLHRSLARLDGMLEDGASADPAKRARVLEALRQTALSTQAACDRIETVLRTLDSFSKADGAELDDVDLARCLEDALTLTAHERPASVTVETSLPDDLRRVRASPQEMGQLCRALLTAATAELGSSGKLRVAARDDGEAVVVEVARDGAPLPTDVVNPGVDVTFDATGSRVRASMDLPVAHAIAHRHGGAVTVGVEQSWSAVYRARIPVAAPASAGG